MLEIGKTYKVIETGDSLDQQGVTHNQIFTVSLFQNGKIEEIQSNQFTLTNENMGNSIDILVTNEYVLNMLEIKKVNPSGEGLLDAEFSVFRDGMDSDPVYTYTTDENGVLKIFRQYGNQEYSDGVLYYIKETKAPAGYVISGDKIYFYFADEDQTFRNVPKDAVLVNLKKSFDSVRIENSRAVKNEERSKNEERKIKG